MNTRILDEAASEFADAIARYESIESGLGVRLKQEVKSALAWISAHPELPRVRPVLRRILCPSPNPRILVACPGNMSRVNV